MHCHRTARVLSAHQPPVQQRLLSFQAKHGVDLHVCSTFSIGNSAILVNLPGCLSDRVKRPTDRRAQQSTRGRAGAPQPLQQPQPPPLAAAPTPHRAESFRGVPGALHCCWSLALQAAFPTLEPVPRSYTVRPCWRMQPRSRSRWTLVYPSLGGPMFRSPALTAVLDLSAIFAATPVEDIACSPAPAACR